MKKLCEVPECNKPAKKWPGQPPEQYCDEHLWQINHAVVRGNVTELRAKLRVK